MLTDAILETHDRIVGKLYSTCKRVRDDQLSNQKKLANETLKSFITLGKKLIKGHKKNLAIADVIDDTQSLQTLMETAHMLTKRLDSDPLNYVLMGYHRFRLYTPRMLEVLSFEGNQAAIPLLEAITMLDELNTTKQDGGDQLFNCFANAQWQKLMGSQPERKLWETAILFAIRDGLRSRDIWVEASRSYQDSRQQLLPVEQAQQTLSLPIPLNAETWIESRTNLLQQRIKEVARMIRQGNLPNSCIEKGKIRVNRLDRQIPEGMEQLTMEIYRQMPQCSITDILQEVDEDIGFTDYFSHIHTGSPCSDKIGLLNVLLAGGINMGLKKMALCSSSHASFWPLLRVSTWHITPEAMTDALAAIIEKHHNLPLSAIWGDGTTSSSDGQFLANGGTGEAMNVVNVKYGTVIPPIFRGVLE